MHRSNIQGAFVVPSQRRPDLRFLVTGARGFIGTALVSRLAAEGYEVHATTRRDGDAHLPVRWWQLDLTDSVQTDRIVAEVRPDVVIHLASQASGDRELSAVAPMVRDNLLTTINVMSAVSTHVPRARVVLAGSIEEPRSVVTGRGAHSPYAAAKAASTIYATLYRDLWQMCVVVLRVAMVYGPGDPHTRRLVPHVLSHLVADVPPRLTSGDRFIDWLYVDDAVEAFVTASTADTVCGAVMDIGSGRPVTIRETVERAVALSGTKVRPQFGTLPNRAEERSHIADIASARDLMGWSATTTLDDGLTSTIDWYRRIDSGQALGTGGRDVVGTSSTYRPRDTTPL